jgi:5'-3' exonuclease
MINVLIDGNYIFHKTFGVFGGYGNKNPMDILGTSNEQSMFIRKISTDLTSSLRSIPTGGRLVFTADSRSWRKDVEIEGGGYKSNRVKDDEVDWSVFFNLLTSYGEHLEKMGFIFSRVNGAEGDDLLYFWADYLNTKDENCIIVSGDKDLHQLARWKNDNWTIVWNANSKNNVLSVPENWEDRWLNKNSAASVFDMGSVMDPDKEKLKTFINKVEVNEIIPRDFVFVKMLVGDKGDAVPGIWEVQKGSRTQRITPKKAEVILESLKSTEWSKTPFSELIEDDNFLQWASKYCLKLLDDVDSKENREKASENLKRNYKLMWLDKAVIPQEVIEGTIDELKRGISLPKKTITLDRVKIIEGTNWVSAQNAPSQFDPFKDFS